MKRIMAIILSAALLIMGLAGSVIAVVNTEGEDLDTAVSDAEVKVYCQATLDDDFADDQIIVVLNNKASLMSKDYGVSDFSEIQCRSISNLTDGMCDQIEQQMVELEKRNYDQTNSRAEEKIAAFNKILCLRLENPGKENVLKAIKEIEKRDDVICVSPDYYGYADDVESSYDEYSEDQWALDKISLSNAWDYTTGDNIVYVGVLDTGIDGTHPDLARILDLGKSRRFVLGAARPMSDFYDVQGHGTHVAGIIAAQLNGTGVVGVAQNVRIVSLDMMSYNASTKKGTYQISDLIAAINYAEEIGIQILNLSGSGDSDSSALKEAIENFSGLFVCSAGNNEHNINTSGSLTYPRYPASYDYDNLITVGASTSDDRKASYSNYGTTAVDIFAPGDHILSCYPVDRCTNNTHDTLYTTHYQNGYHYMSGTSMATPFVTGVAALMLSECPALTAEEIKTRIINTCDKIATFTNLCASGGRLNAYNAVSNTHDMMCRKGNISSHNWVCDCGKTIAEMHSWISVGTKKMCGVCGLVTAGTPVEFNKLPNEGNTDTSICTEENE